MGICSTYDQISFFTSFRTSVISWIRTINFYADVPTNQLFRTRQATKEIRNTEEISSRGSMIFCGSLDKITSRNYGE